MNSENSSFVLNALMVDKAHFYLQSISNSYYYILRHSLTESQPWRNVHVKDIPVC